MSRGGARETADCVIVYRAGISMGSMVLAAHAAEENRRHAAGCGAESGIMS